MFLTKQELLLDWSVISKVYHKKYFKSRQFKLRTMQLLTQKHRNKINAKVFMHRYKVCGKVWFWADFLPANLFRFKLEVLSNKYVTIWFFKSTKNIQLNYYYKMCALYGAYHFFKIINYFNAFLFWYSKCTCTV